MREREGNVLLVREGKRVRNDGRKQWSGEQRQRDREEKRPREPRRVTRGGKKTEEENKDSERERERVGERKGDKSSSYRCQEKQNKGHIVFLSLLRKKDKSSSSRCGGTSVLGFSALNPKPLHLKP